MDRYESTSHSVVFLDLSSFDPAHGVPQKICRFAMDSTGYGLLVLHWSLHMFIISEFTYEHYEVIGLNETQQMTQWAHNIS